MHTQDIRYSEGGVECLGYLAFDDTAPGRRPGVLVFHEGLGLGEHIMERTRRIAKLGYVAFAPDMFGGRRQFSDLQEMGKLLSALRSDLPTLRARARAALATLISFPQVDGERLAAIGFCFGGSVVLELARDGADLRAVVSLHGVLSTKAPAQPGKVKASVLICTGAEDPLPLRTRWPHSRMRCARQRFGIGRWYPTETRCMHSPIPLPDPQPCKGRCTMGRQIAGHGWLSGIFLKKGSLTRRISRRHSRDLRVAQTSS